MVRKWPKIILMLLVMACFITLTSCKESSDVITNDEEITINIDKANDTVRVGDFITLRNLIGLTRVSYYSSDEEVISISISERFGFYQGRALKEGAAIITAKSNSGDVVAEYLVTVISNKPTKITISGDNSLSVGETILLNASVEPEDLVYKINWKSSDENVAVVTSDGALKGISNGVALITATVDGYNDIASELLVLVKGGSSVSTSDPVNNEEENITKTIDVSTLSNIYEPIIMKAKTFVVGVNSYIRLRQMVSLYESASGVIYKRYCILNDGTEVEDDGNVASFYAYKYYVITCKHVIDKASIVEVYYGDVTYEANIIAYDKKIDLGVITFVTDRYFATASFADSSEVETGEFVFAFGSNYGEEYFNSATMGVVSYYSRYVSTDTDDDGTNDWDSLYIQHDCAIGDGSSGGPLLNMKGQVIGINSKKISSAKIDNMGFAIPSNLTIELCDQLAQGITE